MTTLYLSGCESKKASFVHKPQFPKTGKTVDNELRKYCMPKNKCPRGCVPKPICPGVWEWMNRLKILQQQLDNK